MQATPDDAKEGHGVYSVAEVNKLSEDQLVKLLQALDRERKVEDCDTARVLSALARSFLDQGKDVAALPLLEKSLDIMVQIKGPGDQETTTVLIQLMEVRNIRVSTLF